MLGMNPAPTVRHTALREMEKSLEANLATAHAIGESDVVWMINETIHFIRAEIIEAERGPADEVAPLSPPPAR
jgi:hypothetical protein